MQSQDENSKLHKVLCGMHSGSDVSKLSEGLCSASSGNKSTPSEYYDAVDTITSDEEGYLEPTSEDSLIGEAPNVETKTTHTEEERDLPEGTSQGRRRLPVAKPKTDQSQLSILVAVLWGNLGTDFTTISLPVFFSEPINVLQRMCEEFEYSELLDKAAQLEDPGERMLYVALFAVSGYNATVYRHERKPYTPLLGETYECVRKDKGFRFIAEKVCHQPNVCTSYVESNNYTYTETITLNTKFWGKSVEFVPKGKSIMNLRQPTTSVKSGDPDCYEWTKVTTCLQNVFGPG